mgnify:CR=1 FL=1
MEFKCAFCGKTYSDADEYAKCVIACRDLEKSKKAEEERKKRETEKSALKAQMKYHYDEYIKLCKELDKKFPECSEDGEIIEICCQDLSDVFNRFFKPW